MKRPLPAPRNKMRKPSGHIHFRTAALCAAVLLFLLPTSCRKKENDMIPNFGDRTKVPGMWLDSVTTLISDSGVIRYRVVTERWDAYDKADDPYWFFPQKVYFERFNDTLVIESTVESDTAWYYYDRKLWVLRQNVKVRNLSGETFETTLLNWNQDTHRVYSDTAFIRIRQSSQILTGHGFESNESMTNYTIHQIEGMFPIDKDTTAVNDSSVVEIPVRDEKADTTSSAHPRKEKPQTVERKSSRKKSSSSSSQKESAPVRKVQKKVMLSEEETKDN